MKSAELDNLVKTGHLIEEPPLPGEIRNALERAENWRVFNDAHKVRNRIAYDGEPLDKFSLINTGLVEALLQATDRLGKCLQELERDREQ